MFWFHCGRCGSLFQAFTGKPEGRLCPNCGADPSPGIMESPAPAPAPAAESEALNVVNHSKRTVRRRRNRNFMLKLIVGWTAILVLIVLGARKIWPSAAPEIRPLPVFVSETPPVLTSDDVALYQSAGPKCAEVFGQFLAAGTPEKSNQFVLSPVSTASRMALFYSLNPIPNIEPATLKLTGSELLKLPGAKAFEAQWQSADGKKLDTVFREENGEWKLDWEHFVRYSDYPWSLFLAGTGPSEGEFRLLARERLAEERKAEETISLVLYAPQFGRPREADFQSPEFLVSRNHRDGQLLDAAFKLTRRGGRVFGEKLPNLDPDGMIRVRVKVRRIDNDAGRKFEIAAVTACHWYSVDDPGVEPEPPAEAKPQER
jgi:hypothetical protein